MMLKPYFSAGLLAVLLFCAHIANRQTTTATSGTLVLTQGLSISVSACFNPGNARSAKQNVPFSCSLLAANGAGGGYVFSKVSGSFPAGISDITAAGLVSGTPTGTSAGTEIVKLIDSAGTSVQASITITPSSLSSSAVMPAGASVQATQTITFTALGTWSDSSTLDISSLAAWSCTTTCGSFSGATFTAGSSSGTATIKAVFNGVTDDGGSGVSLTVSSSTPTIQNSSPLCAGAINQPYPDNAPANPSSCSPGAGENLSATGGTPPYTWAIVSGCPSGLTISASATSSPVPLTGPPSSSGTFASCQIKVTDSATNSFTKTFSITIATQSSTTVAPSSPTLNVGSAIQMAATANYNDSATVDVSVGAGISRLGTSKAGTASSTSSTSLAFPAINLPSGDLLVVQAGCSGTGTISVADTAGNTFTAVDSPTNGPSGATYFDSGLFYAANTTANAADVVTITYGTSCGFQNANLAWYSGIATSTPLDQHALGETNASGSLGSSCGSAAFTTTSAIELLFSSCTNGSTNRTFTPGNNYNLIVTQAGGQSAIEDQIVSSIQSSIKSAFSFSGATDNHIGLTATFKAAAASGAAWSITAGNCTVTSSGIVTANGGTSCTVQASFGGLNGTQTITINSPVLQSIAVTPNPASSSVGSTVQMTATGTFAGGSQQNITTSVNWSSNNTPVATVNSNTGLVSCVVAGSATIAAASGSIHGSSIVTCSTVSNTALLTGCTVSSSNVPSCATPAGWTLNSDGAQSFDQAITSNYVLDGPSSIGTGIGHSGDSAVQCSITGSNNLCGIYYHMNASATSFYASMWVFEQGGSPGTAAACGDDNFMFVVIDQGKSPNPQLSRFQGWPQSPAYLSPHCDPYWFSEGSAGAVSYVPQAGTGTFNLGLGSWTQYEMQMTPNSCTGSTPNNDGSVSIWQSGTLIYQRTATNLNYCPTLRNDTRVAIEAGGAYSATWFSNNGGTNCVARNSGSPFQAIPFSAAPALETDGVTPCWGSQKTFNRRIDDLIFLWK